MSSGRGVGDVGSQGTALEPTTALRPPARSASVPAAGLGAATGVDHAGPRSAAGLLALHERTRALRDRFRRHELPGGEGRALKLLARYPWLVPVRPRSAPLRPLDRRRRVSPIP